MNINTFIMTVFICLLVGGVIGIASYSSVHECPDLIASTETIQMEVTAYCPCEKCCGRWADGHFADGSPVGGRAIAADTSLYPFGTEFSVPGYGVAVVKDRGGAIKGNRLDLYFDTHQEALNWGRQTIAVTKQGDR